MNSWGQNSALASGIRNGRDKTGVGHVGVAGTTELTRASALTHLVQGGDIFVLS